MRSNSILARDKRQRRGAEQVVIEIARLDDPGVRFVGNQPFDQAGELVGERQEDQRIDHIEHRVGVGDLAGRSTADAADEVGEHADERDPDQDADDVEDEVGDGGALGVARLADGGQHRRDRGADVGAQHEGDTGLERDQALAGEHDHHAGGRRRGLDQGGEQGADQNAEEGVLQGGHQVDEGVVAAQRLHGRTHDDHAEEDQAEAHHRRPLGAALLLLGDHRHGEADCDQHQRPPGDVEGDDLRRDRRADVGAEDDRDRLDEGHQPGRDEPDHQHRRDRRRLHDRGDPGTGEQARDAVGGQLLEDAAQAVPGDDPQRLGHAVHAEEEQRQAAEQADDEVEPVDVGRRFGHDLGGGEQQRRHAAHPGCGAGRLGRPRSRVHSQSSRRARSLAG